MRHKQHGENMWSHKKKVFVSGAEQRQCFNPGVGCCFCLVFCFFLKGKEEQDKYSI